MNNLPAWYIRVTRNDPDPPYEPKQKLNKTNEQAQTVPNSEETKQKNNLKFAPTWNATEPFPERSALIHVAVTGKSDDFFEHRNIKPDYFLKVKLVDTNDENDIHAKNIAEFVKSISNKAEYLICCGYWQMEILCAVKLYLYGFPKIGYKNESVYNKILSALRDTEPKEI